MQNNHVDVVSNDKFSELHSKNNDLIDKKSENSEETDCIIQSNLNYFLNNSDTVSEILPITINLVESIELTDSIESIKLVDPLKSENKNSDDIHIKSIPRKKSDTSHITAIKRSVPNSNNRIKKNIPIQKTKKENKLEIFLITIISKIYSFFYEKISKTHSWIERFIDEYFDVKYYFTYLMCYATFLIITLIIIIFEPFKK